MNRFSDIPINKPILIHYSDKWNRNILEKFIAKYDGKNWIHFSKNCRISNNAVIKWELE